ncbi:SMP-30/gluconolactonase/LRE family protein [Variovorax sp. UMC13]|uniref:SMP-30/gluconolactonase/LRE family protein n=1 Tax=Variovorax sp. UMC13 TaxID=1862326 RepID=UPI0016032786|nr:SMP-30/gluconolactonase/LRE family protein [Variovorax sp. UMC13]MBB1601976.1 gluconolactonase [Variovorax sp. UMC13]
MTIEYFDDAAAAVVAPDAPIERIAGGFVFTEGALWHSRDQYLLFSDIDESRMHRWDAQSGTRVFREPSRMTNGNTWDAQGRLLSCEHASSRVVRTEADGTLTVLASHFEGRELNSPNDIVARRDGSIYFSDPIFGRRLPHGTAREPELDHSSVYRIDARGALQRLAVDLEQPNGLCFSLDESLLYVNDSPRKRIHVHRVLADGTVEAGRLFAEVPGDEPGVPDGMKVDLEGRIYCCGPGGIHVFMPDGRRIARIRFPEKACNFAFGDADHHTLYVTACTSLYRIRLRTPGRPQWLG